MSLHHPAILPLRCPLGDPPGALEAGLASSAWRRRRSRAAGARRPLSYVITRSWAGMAAHRQFSSDICADRHTYSRTTPLPGCTSTGPAHQVLRAKLLHRRDHLAAAAAGHAAHGQVGAELLREAAEPVASRLRDVFADIWAEQHEACVATDAARIHTADDPRPGDCRLCHLKPQADAAAAS